MIAKCNFIVHIFVSCSLSTFALFCILLTIYASAILFFPMSDDTFRVRRERKLLEVFPAAWLEAKIKRRSERVNPDEAKRKLSRS